MSRAIYRRRFVGACSAVVGLVAGFPRRAFAAQRPEYEPGYVVGEPTAEVVGKQVLADGGNAVDAIVAAALTAAVAAPNQTGIGGYGMSAMVLQFIGNRQSLTASMAAPRFHTEGGNAIQFEPRWPESETQAMEKIGYVVSKQSSATLSGVAVEDGTLKAAMR